MSNLFGRNTKYGQVIPFVDATKPWNKCVVVRVLGERLFLARFKNGEKRIVSIPPETYRLEAMKEGTKFNHDGTTVIVGVREA